MKRGGYGMYSPYLSFLINFIGELHNMKIIHVNRNTFDVFLDTGWENWSRFKIKFGKVNELFQIKGTRVPKSVMNDLVQRYNTK